MNEEVEIMDRSLITRARSEMTPSRGDLAALKRGVLGAVAGGAVVATATGTAKAAVASSAKTGVATAAGATSVAGAATVGVAVKSAAGVGLAAKFGVVAVVASFGIAGTAVVSGMISRGHSREEHGREESSRGTPHVAKIEAAPSVRVRESAPSVELVAPGSAPAAVVIAPTAGSSSVHPVSRRVVADAPAVAEATEPAVIDVPATDSLRAESDLLRDAHQALAGGNAARAIELLDAHALQFGDGMLAEERAALRARALCTAGRVDEGRREAAAFVAAHPESVQRARIEHDCQ